MKIKTRYQFKRGRRSLGEFDVLIYRDDRLYFRGSFTADRDLRIKPDDVKFIDSIKSALATLEQAP